jgi:hypothetical protein
MPPPEGTSHPVQPSRREARSDAIAQEEARLDRLEAEQADARIHLAAR